MTTKESRAYYAANREKIRADQAVYYVANAEKLKAKSAAYRSANPGKIQASNAANAEKYSASSRMKKYGVSPDCFQLMLAVQQNACDICKEIFSKEPHVDHCHETGEVRGLLCSPCNKGLGFFRDSPEILESAREYLRGTSV